MRRFEEMNPWTVLLWFIAVLVPVMFVKNPLLILFSLAAVLVLRKVMIGAKSGKDIGLIAFMILSVGIINMLVSHNGATAILVVNDNRITLEALAYGMVTGGMLAAIFLWFGLINALCSTDRIMYLLGGISPKLALTVSMTLRYVSLIRIQAGNVRMALKASGEFEDGNGFSAIKVNLKVFSGVTTWVLENGIISADSMAARGYMTGKRTAFSMYRFTEKDAGYIVVVFALSTVFTALYKMLNLNYTYYPEFVLPDGRMYEIPVLLIYLLITFIPLFNNRPAIGREERHEAFGD